MEYTRMGWESRQRKQKNEKNQERIEGCEIIILTETHQHKDEYEIKKIEKYLNEYNIFHVHDRKRAGARSGTTIGVKTIIVEMENIEIKTNIGQIEE